MYKNNYGGVFMINKRITKALNGLNAYIDDDRHFRCNERIKK